MVGGADRLLIMFHDQHGVAEVAQPPQRAEQALVVALMQSDRRLVQHVQHAGQPGTDLARQADALTFATRQRGRTARQRQVIQPDIDQELQPLADLAQDAARDLLPLRRQQCRSPYRTTSTPCGWKAPTPRRCSCRRRAPPALPASAARRCRPHRASPPGSATSPRAPRRCRFPASGVAGCAARPRTAWSPCRRARRPCR